MKRTRFTETQIVGILHEAGGRTSIREVCRRHGVTKTTFFRWRATYGGMAQQEMIAKVLEAWAYEQGIALTCSRPGKPVDNCCVESVHDKFRDECLSLH